MVRVSFRVGVMARVMVRVRVSVMAIVIRGALSSGGPWLWIRRGVR